MLTIVKGALNVTEEADRRLLAEGDQALHRCRKCFRFGASPPEELLQQTPSNLGEDVDHLQTFLPPILAIADVDVRGTAEDVGLGLAKEVKAVLTSDRGTLVSGMSCKTCRANNHSPAISQAHTTLVPV